MTLIGHLHPLLVHFPIALVIIASVAEVAAIVSKDGRWRILAIGNLQAAAAFALLSVAAGWFFALDLADAASPLLQWHRWLGTVAAVITVGAAVVTGRVQRHPRFGIWLYRAFLITSVIVVAITAHVGALLVWGSDFLHL